MADPRKTVQLLNQLVAIGFMNEAFQRLHHMGRRVTIAVHRAYCEKKISSFKKDSTNARVERRLEFVFQKYRAGGFPPGRFDIFNQLADEAAAEIPFNGGKSVPFETTLGPRVTTPKIADRRADSEFFNLSDGLDVAANRPALTQTLDNMSESIQNCVDFEAVAAKAVRCRVCFDLGEVKPARSGWTSTRTRRGSQRERSIWTGAEGIAFPKCDCGWSVVSRNSSSASVLHSRTISSTHLAPSVLYAKIASAM